MSARLFSHGQRSFSSGPKIVGVLNVTPDSFSDGGDYCSVPMAVERAKRMVREGASIIDVGGESTRPNASSVDVGEEISRVCPVIKAIAASLPDVDISIDTTKPLVARAALDAGATIVNDVNGFLGDSDQAVVVADKQAACILMYNSRLDTSTGSVVDRVFQSWEKSVKTAIRAGVSEGVIVLDPGIGFGTTRDEDLVLLASLARFKSFGFPLMLGASRKRVTGEPLGLKLEQRLETTLATTVVGVEAGVELFRVHDVMENLRAANMAKLIYDKRNG